ncbi:hypothetical protein [Bacterioplanoides sp.]|uniref:hypothetical protein n=1 Tax=Bacterioplanoides sp. TaxID=2066072 RepID=UPI003B5CC7D2
MLKLVKTFQVMIAVASSMLLITACQDEKAAGQAVAPNQAAAVSDAEVELATEAEVAVEEAEVVSEEAVATEQEAEAVQAEVTKEVAAQEKQASANAEIGDANVVEAAEEETKAVASQE